MIFDYKFKGKSEVSSNSKSVGLSFVPDVNRQPTYFSGEVKEHIPFREAISALHQVVTEDLRYQPKERIEYKEWAASQEELWIAQELAKQSDIENEIEQIQERLKQLKNEHDAVMGPFYKARQKYFDYLYKKDRDAWMVLDPVITVHPDEIFFECLSKDESVYGKLSCDFSVFKNVNEFECGTTNIDYSVELYNEFQKIREYKDTSLVIDPSGFNVETTDEGNYREEKIDLPDSWVRGFLQVSSVTTLPSRSFELTAGDIYSICLILKKFKEKSGPRSIRFKLTPGQPIKITFDPWGYEYTALRSKYEGKQQEEIRVWGRKRVNILERLIPISKGIKVHLYGSGMPSFFICELVSGMTFTLGLSGWTANDWSKLGNFDLLTPKKEVTPEVILKVYTHLKKIWRDDSQNISSALGIDHQEVLYALTSLTQEGKVIYDLDKKVFRLRELTKEPIKLDKVRFINQQEREAYKLLKGESVKILDKRNIDSNCTEITAEIKDKEHQIKTTVIIDEDDKVINASCTCNFFTQNKLMKGPCRHIIAIKSSR